MSLHIYIDTIAHEEQRYPTVGDYWRPEVPHHALKRTEIRVSEMGNEAYELLVAIHEMVEEYLTREAGITEQQITQYDVQYEAARTAESLDEPGENEDAPYHKQHLTATEIERFIAERIGVDWDEYNNAVNSLA